MVRTILIASSSALAVALAGGAIDRWAGYRAGTVTTSANLGAVEDRWSTADPILVVSPDRTLDQRKVALGRRLFHDPGLSADGTVSCASCHDLARGGADDRRVSVGVGGNPGKVNSPTVFHSARNFRQFWNGRALTLEEQAAVPIENPLEMGTSLAEVCDQLAGSPSYAEAFSEIYADGITPTTVVDAIATFERSLVIVGNRFDRYLQGDNAALSASEQAGYQLFHTLGCIACHQGENVGGNLYQKMGVAIPYVPQVDADDPSHLGRLAITGAAEDRQMVKVPGLRLVARTAPYFHDGSALTLHGAIEHMARHQLGIEISYEETEQIAEFLGALSDGGSLP